MDIQAMIEYMNAHEKRYDTHGYRYSKCIKVYQLGLSEEQVNACMDALTVDNAHEFSGFNEALENFEANNPGFEIFSKGRNGGYLILHNKNVDMFDYNNDDADEVTYRYNVLKAFDEAVEDACAAFVDFALEHKVVEKTIMVPKVVKVFDIRT